MASLVLYDLTGAEDDHRFSPYCWRTRMALAHKGLEIESRPWRFTEKEAIAFSGQSKVPVLVDGEQTVSDSWAIAVYLEETYPDRPSLFGGAAGQALCRFINEWTDRVVMRGIAPMIIADVYDHLHEKDRAYFRESREKAFGAALEDVVADRDTRVVAFRRTLDPLRATLKAQPYLAGAAPGYADYIVFGTFQWARCTSQFALLATDDPIAAWIETMLDAFDGLGRSARS